MEKFVENHNHFISDDNKNVVKVRDIASRLNNHTVSVSDGLSELLDFKIDLCVEKYIDGLSTIKQVNEFVLVGSGISLLWYTDILA